VTDNQSPELFGQTPSQTVGPFFHYALPWPGGGDLLCEHDWGARLDLIPAGHDVLNRPSPRQVPGGRPIEIVGRVTDGEGQAVPDALLEIWQADANGDCDGTGDFIGFGRSATGEDGAFRFRTLYPGRVRGPGDVLQAPHIALSILGRGLLKRLATRLYFADDEANADDPILALVPEARRDTLIATQAGADRWRFDIALQGERETVFLAL